MIEGAIILLAGLVAGWLARGARREKSPETVTAVCGCTHARSMHVDGTGKCMEIGVDSYWEYSPKTDDQVMKHKEYPCSCQLYDGPEPLQGYYAPEIEG